MFTHENRNIPDDDNDDSDDGNDDNDNLDGSNSDQHTSEEENDDADLRAEMRQFMDNDFQEESVPKHISPTVTCPENGNQVYKLTLVSMLNEDPKLSKDRFVLHLS